MDVLTSWGESLHNVYHHCVRLRYLAILVVNYTSVKLK